MFQLQPKTALVTGGNGGIGLAIAQGLVDAGARVAVVGRNPDKLRAAVETLTRRGGQAQAYQADVSDEAAVAALFDQDVEPAKIGRHPVKQCGHRRLVADIGLVSLGLAAAAGQGLDRGAQLVGVAADHRHPSAGVHQALCHGQTDATVAAGDEGGLGLKLEHGAVLSFKQRGDGQGGGKAQGQQSTPGWDTVILTDRPRAPPAKPPDPACHE